MTCRYVGPGADDPLGRAMVYIAHRDERLTRSAWRCQPSSASGDMSNIEVGARRELVGDVVEIQAKLPLEVADMDW